MHFSPASILAFSLALGSVSATIGESAVGFSAAPGHLGPNAPAKRQESCDTALLVCEYKTCFNPNVNNCCTDGSLCLVTEYCVYTSTAGDIGCCPVGEQCTGGSQTSSSAAVGGNGGSPTSSSSTSSPTTRPNAAGLGMQVNMGAVAGVALLQALL